MPRASWVCSTRPRDRVAGVSSRERPGPVGLNLLLIPASYPHPGAEWAGIFNEHSALALQRDVRHIEVLVPTPYVPRLLASSDRWRTWTARERLQRGVRVHRATYPVLPKIFQGFWPTRAAALFVRRRARILHGRVGFDAILSFDLARTGGLAWRLGRDLGVPACGWATGTDIRHGPGTSLGRSVREALAKLDLVFYQSGELKTLGAALLGTHVERLQPDRHVVQARGVGEPDTFPGDEVRHALRSSLGIRENQVVVLYLGRIARGKGVFELVEGFSAWGRANADLVLLLVGSRPGHDDARELERTARVLPVPAGRIQILPGCEPQRIWDYFRAADIFAFPSFREGMPNSLLEAMLARLPAVAFSIPSIQEITRFGKGLVEVPAHDFPEFGKALLELAADPSRRQAVAERGRTIAREHFSIRTCMRAVVSRIETLTRGSACSV